MCIYFFSLCYALFWGEEVEKLQCVASTRYSLYCKQICALLHLDFSSICGVNSSLPVLIQVPVQQNGSLGDSQQMHALWGQIFLQNFVWALSPSITGRRKIGGFQRLTSVLRWWLTTMGTKRKGGLTENWVPLCEEWDWRRLLFEGREANPPESTWVWLCYTFFLAWFQSPFACTELPWSLLPEPAGENDAGNCHHPWEHQWLGWWREEIKCQCVEVKRLLKRRKTYLLKFFHLYPVFCSTAVLCLATSFILLLHWGS